MVCDCKTLENPNFLRKGKTVISVKNMEFFQILDDEMDFTNVIVLRNLATTSNFVEFRVTDVLNKGPKWDP